MLVLIENAQTPPFNALAAGLEIYISFRQYFASASSEGSGESTY